MSKSSRSGRVHIERNQFGDYVVGGHAYAPESVIGALAAEALASRSERGAITAEDFKRFFAWLNEADQHADAMYDLGWPRIGRTAAQSKTYFKAAHHGHRISGSLSALRHRLEEAAGIPLNGSRAKPGERNLR